MVGVLGLSRLPMEQGVRELQRQDPERVGLGPGGAFSQSARLPSGVLGGPFAVGTAWVELRGPISRIKLEFSSIFSSFFFPNEKNEDFLPNSS